MRPTLHSPKPDGGNGARSAVDHCSDAIRRLLISESYRPGDRLPSERELARSLDVSRPVIRESIRRLATGGLLVARRGAGTFVADIRPDDVFAIRKRLEPLAAELAAVHRTPEEIKRLERLVREMKETIEDPVAFSAHDADVHRLIAAASGNPLLWDLLASLTEQIRLTRARTSHVAPVRTATLRDISETVDAIAAGEPHKAARAMERHLSNVEASAIQSVEDESRLARMGRGS